MSRNFELLQQAGLELPGGGTAGVEIPFGGRARVTASTRAKDRAHVASLRPADLDRAAREETLRLVQSVFLLHGESDGESGRWCSPQWMREADAAGSVHKQHRFWRKACQDRSAWLMRIFASRHWRRHLVRQIITACRTH